MKKISLRSIAVITGISVALLNSCTGKNQPSGSETVIKVEIDTVQESDEVSKVEYVGIIEEKSSVALGFPVLGTIERIYVSEGEFIRRNQLLATLDKASAKSMFEAAEATRKQAQDAYDRLKSIYDKGSLPEIQMVDIETKLHQANSSYELAERNLKNCDLYAPSEGVVGQKMAEAGEYIMPGITVLTILDISTVKAKFSVPENEISEITSGCNAEITVSALGNKKFTGKKIEKNVVANPISHTYPAHVILSNPGKELLPGMVCNVELGLSKISKGIIVPISIVQTTADNRKFVWTEKEGTAKRNYVTTGAVRGNGVEIISGLTAGDRIVREGFQKISEDDKIAGK